MSANETELLPRSTPDAELLTLMRAGHSSAYALLMRRNNQRLYRLARGIVADDAEAEEAVQETYLRAFTHLDGFRGGSSLATWLARIVLNEALARCRRRRPAIDADAPEADAAPGLFAPEEASPERLSARREIRRAIEQAVDRLPPPFRAVFIMRAIEEMSTAETAACLHIPCETVKTRLHRANQLLRHTLRAEFGSMLDDAFPFLGARCDGLTARVLDRLGMPIA